MPKTRKPEPTPPPLLNSWIDGHNCNELASVRRAAPPFTDQTSGDLVAISFRTFDGGGMDNVRLSRTAAIALRDCLFAYFQRGPLSMRIGQCADGKLTLEERAQ